MNYYEIGQRIRKYRKDRGLSQEQLAEAANISVTHMSHIETGNTKLSLPVLADIAGRLNIPCDRLLYDTNSTNEAAINNLIKTLESCDEKQIKIICEVVAALKNSMDKNL